MEQMARSMRKKPAHEKQKKDAGGKKTKAEMPKKQNKTDDKEYAGTGFTWFQIRDAKAWWPDPQDPSLERLWVLRNFQRTGTEVVERWVSTDATRPK